MAAELAQLAFIWRIVMPIDMPDMNAHGSIDTYAYNINARTSKGFKLSEKTVDTLLDQLSSNDFFRELFRQDPRQALAAAGHVETADNLISDEEWRSMKAQPLASKDVIMASRNHIRNQLLTEQACKSVVSVDMQKTTV